MATSGNLIQQSNFSTSWAMQYENKSHGSKDNTHYLFICAPCWYIVVNAHYAILGGSGIVQVCCDYYNGSTWIEGSRQEVSGVNGAVQKRFSHNRDEGNRAVGYDSEYPLWRIRYWSSRANDNWNISFYAGSWRLAVDTSGNPINYPKGKHIFSRGRTGDATMMHDSGTTDDSANVLNTIFNPTKRRGSLIDANDDSELIWAPYLEERLT